MFGSKAPDQAFPSPNPAQDILNLDLNGLEKAIIRLLDLNGREIQTISTNGHVSMDVSALPRGIYLVAVRPENQAPILKRFTKH